MADGMNGADALLLVNTGTVAAPVWTAVASQRGLTLNETQGEIDFSNKTSGRAARFGPGRWDGTIDLDSLYIPNGGTYQLMRDSARLGLALQLRLQISGDDAEQYNAFVTSFPQDFPDQEAATVSMSLRLDGFPSAL